MITRNARVEKNRCSSSSSSVEPINLWSSRKIAPFRFTSGWREKKRMLFLPRFLRPSFRVYHSYIIGRYFKRCDLFSSFSFSSLSIVHRFLENFIWIRLWMRSLDIAHARVEFIIKRVYNGSSFEWKIIKVRTYLCKKLLHNKDTAPLYFYACKLRERYIQFSLFILLHHFGVIQKFSREWISI